MEGLQRTTLLSIMDADFEVSIKAFHFLKLPVEIRLMIYNELLIEEHDIELRVSENLFGDLFVSPWVARAHATIHTTIYPAITRTCRSVYQESLQILYSRNVFQFTKFGPRFRCGLHRGHVSDQYMHRQRFELGKSRCWKRENSWVGTFGLR